MYVVNGSDGPCIVAVRLMVGVRYLERPLMEVLLYTHIIICAFTYVCVLQVNTVHKGIPSCVTRTREKVGALYTCVYTYVSDHVKNSNST